MFIFFTVLHIFHVSSSDTEDMSTQPLVSPAAEFPMKALPDDVDLGSTIPFHDGFLTCGGQNKTGEPFSNNCYHFDPHRKHNPVVYPAISVTRLRPLMTKALSKPWVIGGQPGEYSTREFSTN